MALSFVLFGLKRFPTVTLLPLPDYLLVRGWGRLLVAVELNILYD